MNSTEVLGDKCVQTDPRFTIIADYLAPFGLFCGDEIEAVQQRFYDDDDVVLADLDGVFVIGKLSVCGASRYHLHIPGSAFGPERGYYASFSQIVGAVLSMEEEVYA